MLLENACKSTKAILQGTQIWLQMAGVAPAGTSVRDPANYRVLPLKESVTPPGPIRPPPEVRKSTGAMLSAKSSGNEQCVCSIFNIGGVPGSWFVDRVLPRPKRNGRIETIRLLLVERY